MKKSFHYRVGENASILIAASILTTGNGAAKDQSQGDEEYKKVYAARLFKRYGKGSDVLTKDALGPDWKRVARADRNKDGRIPFGEYLASTKVPTIDWEGEQRTNIKYKSTPAEDLYFDLYYPTAKKSKMAPLLVYIHGGGWAAGSKDIRGGGVVEVFRQLAKQGFACASVNYRLTANAGIFMRDCVTDTKDMLRYVSRHQEDLEIDPNRIYTLGHSAGGHLSQMLLLVPPDELKGDQDLANHTYTTIAGVSWAGPGSFEDMELFTHPDGTKVRDRFGPRISPGDASAEERKQRAAEVSPVHYLQKGKRPLLMIHGDQDTTIPYHHGVYMKEQGDQIGAPVDYLLLKGVGHGVGTPAAVDATVHFILQHQGHSKPVGHDR